MGVVGGGPITADRGRENEVLPNGGRKAKKMANADDGSKNVTPRSWLLLRPLEVLMSLPVEYR
jgi:hypothetical protein